MENANLHELAKLLEMEREYVVEMWTILQEVRLWAGLNGLELPACAKSDRAFFVHRYSDIRTRHTRIIESLSATLGIKSDVNVVVVV